MTTLFWPVRAGLRVLKWLGVRRTFLIGSGAVVGVLVTPVTGPELRRRIITGIARRRAGAEPTVEERVRARLADSPRTWHLPQPEVVAVRGTDETDWKIILAGTAPDEGSRTDLETVAAAVTGVASIDNRLRVTGGKD